MRIQLILNKSTMKIKFTHLAVTILFFLFTLNTFKAGAQAGVGLGYTFTTTAGTTLTIPTGMSLYSAGTKDDSCSTVFTGAHANAFLSGYPGFTFGGILYDGFYLSSNGFVQLTTGLANNSAVAGNPSDPTNSIATAAGPRLAFLWDDLSIASAQAKWDGTYLWFRLATVKWDKTNAGSTSLFAVRLRPSTGVIDYYYPFNTLFASTGASASIGIIGPCAGDYYSVRDYVTGSGVHAVDSSVANNTLAAWPGKDSIMIYTFTPRAPSNDNCSGAISLGSITSTPTAATYATVHATKSVASGAALDTTYNDIWFSFTKPAGQSGFKFSTDSAASCKPLSATTVEVFSGACGSLTSLGGSRRNLANSDSLGEVTIDRTSAACSSEVLYARVAGFPNTSTGVGKFKVYVQDITGYTCANAYKICTQLTTSAFSLTGQTTKNSVNDYTSANSVCNSAYLAGPDYVFSYTPSTTQCVKFVITNTGTNSYPGLFVYDGCPTDLVNTHCIATATATSAGATIYNVSLTSSQTYYIVVDNNSSLGPAFIPFDINVSIATPSAGYLQDACPPTSSADLGTLDQCTLINYGTNFTTECATPSSTTGYPNPACAGFIQGSGATSITGDVWLKFTTSSGTSGNVTVDMQAGSLSPALSDGGMAIYTGSCGAFTLVTCDDNSSANALMPKITFSASASTIYYIRVWSANSSSGGTFQVSVQLGATGDSCANALKICSLPYSASGFNTAIHTDYYNANTPCSSSWLGGKDYIFKYTPASTTCLAVTVTSTITTSYPGVFVYDGCPESGSTKCIAQATQSSALAAVSIASVTLVGGVTYYFVVSNNSTLAGSSSMTFTFAATSSSVTNSTCATATNLGTLANACASVAFGTNYSTSCYSPSSDIPYPSCAGYLSGRTGDNWLKFTTSFSGAVTIDTKSNGSPAIVDAGMALYSGSCGGLTLVTCDDNSSSNASMPKIISTLSAGTYYIRVWSKNPNAPGQFQISLAGPSVGGPSNDLPCGSILVNLGIPVTGDNSCATNTFGSSEPASPTGCGIWTGNPTVWYKVVVPATRWIKVRVVGITITDPVVAAYSFPTGCSNAFSSNSILNCNDDATLCGASQFGSFISVTGIASGIDTVYIEVSKYGTSASGTFRMTVYDGSGPPPAISKLDCSLATAVCGNGNIVEADPGPVTEGNICDITGAVTGGCGTAENNAGWYQFSVVAGSSTGFTITPSASADYNFILWDITGVSNPCSGLTTRTPKRCNFTSGTGATGLSHPTATFFADTIGPQATDRTYLLYVNKVGTGTSVGFTLNWGINTGGTTNISGSIPSSVTWNGSTDTLYSTLNNWTGPCTSALPSCTIDAFISASTKQPIITGSRSVFNLDIELGTTLTLAAGSDLTICGNLIVNGSLICGAGSTVIFSSGADQTVTGIGTLTGTGGFASLLIDKTGGSVTMYKSFDVKEDFTVASSTSIFNINGQYMKLGGNFTNYGMSTFLNPEGSTLEFNGSSDQYFSTYNTSADTTFLGRVYVNKTVGGDVILDGSGPPYNGSMVIDSALTLGTGDIITTANSSLRVILLNNGNPNTSPNTPPVAISGFSANSYIQGKLKRRVNQGNFTAFVTPSAWVLDYPVGTATKYEYASIWLTRSSNVNFLEGYFSSWSCTPPAGPLPALGGECKYANYANDSLFNHGYWTFLKSENVFDGRFNLTANSTGMTNDSWPSGGHTIVKADTTSNPCLAASWSLLGKCHRVAGVYSGYSSTNTLRDSINHVQTSTDFFNSRFAIAQEFSPFPISLLYFIADPEKEGVQCSWETASEINNEYFYVERSSDAKEFTTIGKVKGHGAGTSTQPLYYTLFDGNPPCYEVLYYRLKQVDIDGKSSYSDIVAINCNNKNVVSLYPNPANTELNINFYQPLEGNASIRIVDILGKTVLETTNVVHTGYNVVTLKITDLPQGVYYMKLMNSDDDTNTSQTKLVKFLKY